MCYYGNAFPFNDVYNMPVHLRKFYYNKLVETKEKENEAAKNASSSSTPMPKIPNFKGGSGKVKMR